MTEIRSTAKEYVDDQTAHLREVLEARFDGLDAKIDGAISGLDAKMDGLRAEMQGLRSEMQGLRSEIQAVGTKIDAMLALYQPLVRDVRRLQQDVDIMKEMLSGKELRGFTRETPDEDPGA